jgi:hypothetical protein
MNLKRIFQLGALGLTMSLLSVQAQVFNYTDGDLILDFSTAGYSDVEVDIGNVTNLISAAKAAGGTVQLGAYDVNAQLLATFGSVDSLSFSVVGLQNLASGSIAANTSYLAQKQTGAGPNTPPNDLTLSAQNTVKGTIQHIVGLGNSSGILPWSAANPADPVNNTVRVVIIPTSGTQALNSYTKIVGASFSGAAAIGGGAPKNTTSATFSTDGGSIVSDLFEFDPVGSSHQSIYKGYFTFNSDGTLDFSVPALPRTVITAITAIGGTVSVTFNTVAGVNYRLRYSSQLNASLGTWTIIAGSAAGTGSPATLNDTSATGAARFYAVESY